MPDLTGVIELLGDGLEPIFFGDIVDQLERVPDGKGLLALLAVVNARVSGENGQQHKNRRVISLVRACKKKLPPDQRQEVIDLLNEGWENLEPGVRREVLSALAEGPVWDLSSLIPGG